MYINLILAQDQPFQVPIISGKIMGLKDFIVVYQLPVQVQVKQLNY